MRNKSALAAVAILILGSAACSPKKDDDQHASVTPTNVTLTAELRSHIQFYTVAAAPFHKTIDTTGAVDFDNDKSTSVISPMSGPVTRLMVSPGDPVRKGQALAELYVPDWVAAQEEFLAVRRMGSAAPPALREVIVRARRGERQAQLELAQSFLKGDGFAADPIAAARWSDEAAAQGDATAQFILGTLYAEGIKPNPRLAFAWFSAAASRGNVKAMHNLAIAYLNGAGVSEDAQAAAAWFEKAAGAGYRDSAFDLAVLYERGEGVKQSGRDALKWYEQAAAQGDPEAMQRATYLREQLRQVVAKR